MSNDHTDAATITPEAKPSSVRCTLLAERSPTNSTVAAPITVPANGIAKSGKIS
jgi:hypothetical protein